MTSQVKMQRANVVAHLGQDCVLSLKAYDACRVLKEDSPCPAPKGLCPGYAAVSCRGGEGTWRGGHLVLLVEHSVLLAVEEGRRGVASCFVQYVHG